MAPTLMLSVCQPELLQRVQGVLPNLGVQQLHPLTGLDQLLLSQLSRPLCLLHHSTQLLQLSLQQSVAPLYDGDVLLQVIIGPDCVIQLDLGVLRIRRMGVRWPHCLHKAVLWKMDVDGKPIVVP